MTYPKVLIYEFIYVISVLFLTFEMSIYVTNFTLYTMEWLWVYCIKPIEV